MVAPHRLDFVFTWASGCGLQVGWKHQDAVKELEEKRKVRSAAYYEQKKKLNALRIKAAAEA
jgi:large subunit ribosomal protein L13Ae